MSLESRAKEFASEAHFNQRRKYTGVLYITHPESVVNIVRTVEGHTEEMLVAAWLHDTVEDCGIELGDISDIFGWNVMQLVSDLTDVSKKSDGNRATRKKIDLLHTSKASPQAKTIKIADLIDNTDSIFRFDPDFAKVYLPEKMALLEVLKDGDPGLWTRAYSQVNRYLSMI